MMERDDSGCTSFASSCIVPHLCHIGAHLFVPGITQCSEQMSTGDVFEYSFWWVIDVSSLYTPVSDMSPLARSSTYPQMWAMYRK